MCFSCFLLKYYQGVQQGKREEWVTEKEHRTKIICHFKLNVGMIFNQISSIFSHFLIISYHFIIFDFNIISAMKYARTVYILSKYIKNWVILFTGNLELSWSKKNSFVHTKNYRCGMWWGYHVVISWVNDRKYEIPLQINTDCLASLKTWYYSRLCFI